MTQAVDPLQTHRPVTVPIDLQSRQATITKQWLLEKNVTHPITTGNRLQTLICGEEGFAAIAADIEAAKESINLVCWGFDPGMALVRNQSMPLYPWAHGEPYGELLRRKAKEGVVVRLLVWYSARGSAKQNSLIGYVVPNAYIKGSTISSTWDEDHPHAGANTKPLGATRQDYCTRWWREATSGQIANLEVRCRDGVSSRVKTSINDEADKPSAAGGAAAGYIDEEKLLNDWATHHQKPILIDYAYADAKDQAKGPGHKAVGYVMGLNSLSDFWDTCAHAFDHFARERDLAPGLERDGSDPISSAAAAKGWAMSRRPLRDYACRVEGKALEDVYLNFCAAWNRAGLLPKLSANSNAKSNATASAALDATLRPSALAIPINNEQRHLALRLQILRTQPEEQFVTTDKTWAFDKSVKHAYFHVASVARSYLYLENQYFFYEEWARHLKTNRQTFMQWLQEAGASSQDARLLHLIAVIPAPENPGMLPRTFDTLKSLGQGDSLPNQQALVEKENKEWFTSDVAKTATQVKAPTPGQDGVLMQDGKSLGLKVLVCKLVSHNKEGSSKELGLYRDIYIHSKLMLADDCYMTIGSANLNQRSMAADSEINVATDNIPHNRALRQRIWGQLTDGKYAGGNASQQEIEDAFFRWRKLAEDNAGNLDKGQPLKGQIVKFSDGRSANDRVG